MACSRFASLPADRRSEIPSGLTTATPAESYPRYSIRRRPSMRTGTTGFEPMYPMIPHIAVFLGLRLVLAASGFPALDPPVHVRLAPPRDAQRPVRNVLRNRRAGGHVGPLADTHGRNQLRVAADERPVFDDRRVLLRPVVVAGYGSGADIHPLADGGIAEVGEVVGLRPRAHRGLLQLHEIADLCSLAHHGLRSQVRERPDRRPLCNTRTDDEAEVEDHGSVSDFGPDDADIAVDFAGGSHAALSLDRHTRVDHR